MADFTGLSLQQQQALLAQHHAHQINVTQAPQATIAPQTMQLQGMHHFSLSNVPAQAQAPAAPAAAAATPQPAATSAAAPAAATPAATPAPAAAVPTYPAARAPHSEVVANKALFYETLREVHSHFGITGANAPKIVAGVALDLHTLYCEVTRLGGAETVVQRKRWREIAEPLGVPANNSNTSSGLKKAYNALLWDYEQVYYIRNTGPRLPAPGTRGGKEDDEQQQPAAAGGAAAAAAAPAAKRQRVTNQTAQDAVATDFPSMPANVPFTLTAQATTQGHPASAGLVGSKGTVHVDCRFDCGYFVTVRIKAQEFKGMLYYPPSDHALHMQGLSRGGQSKAELMFEQLYGPAAAPKPTSGIVRDTSAPKPNKTPFNFFSIDARIKLKEMAPNLGQTDATRKVGELWQKATDFEKAPYVALANQDKARYQAELEAYNYRLAAQAAQAQALQAAQAVAQAAATLNDAPPVAGSRLLPELMAMATQPAAVAVAAAAPPANGAAAAGNQ